MTVKRRNKSRVPLPIGTRVRHRRNGRKGEVINVYLMMETRMVRWDDGGEDSAARAHDLEAVE
jgi:hypothetical protein